jgi:ubiquitin C-terminal hydrolase
VYDNKSQQFKKISTYIDFPETLNIFKYIDTEPNYSFEENSTSKDCEYELFAVIEHRSDSILHGHYVSNIKVRNKWYLFNDGHVFENDKFKTENSFVLFYKRKSAFK